MILVTGSSGFIGSGIAEHLSKTHKVRGLDRIPGKWTDLTVDAGDRKELRRALDGVEAIAHCAAFHAPHVGQVNDELFWRNNVEVTQTLLDLCQEFGIGRFVFTSTTSVFGEAMVPIDRAIWVDEALEPQPRDIYDVTKLEAEARVRSAAGPKLGATILRMSRCFPEAARLMAIYRLYRGVDRRDVAEAHRLALQHASPEAPCYIISAASPFQPDDVVALHGDAARVITRYHPDAAEQFAARGWSLPAFIDRVYDTRRAHAELGYTPRFGLGGFMDGDSDPMGL